MRAHSWTGAEGEGARRGVRAVLHHLYHGRTVHGTWLSRSLLVVALVAAAVLALRPAPWRFAGVSLVIALLVAVGGSALLAPVRPRRVVLAGLLAAWHGDDDDAVETAVALEHARADGLVPLQVVDPAWAAAQWAVAYSHGRVSGVTVEHAERPRAPGTGPRVVVTTARGSLDLPEAALASRLDGYAAARVAGDEPDAAERRVIDAWILSEHALRSPASRSLGACVLSAASGSGPGSAAGSP